MPASQLMLVGVIKGDNESIIRFRWDTDRSLSGDYKMHFSCIRKDGTNIAPANEFTMVYWTSLEG